MGGLYISVTFSTFVSLLEVRDLLLDDRLFKTMNMRIRKVINPKFSSLELFMDTIFDNFENECGTIQDKRNIVKIVEHEGTKYAVKSFARMTLLNRFVYTFFRTTKSKRAYENSHFLLDQQFETPQPIGYVDCFKGGMLRKSIYISEFVEWRDLDDLFELPHEEAIECTKAFADYTYELNRKGIFHCDFILRNVFYKKENGAYRFCLIDNNRMQFTDYSLERSLFHMRNTKMPYHLYTAFYERFAELGGYDPFMVLSQILFYRRKRMRQSEVKRKFKKALGLKGLAASKRKG